MLQKLLRKPKLFIPVVFVIVGLIGFGTAFGISRMDDTASASSCGDQANCINLYGKTADPDTIAVTAGSYIQFNSSDGGKHNIALAHAAVHHEDSSEYESGEFGGDEAWRVQFKKDGAYTFRDKYHPEVKINVIVYTEGKDYKIE